MNPIEQHRLFACLTRSVSGARSPVKRWRALRDRALIGTGLFLGVSHGRGALRLTWDQFHCLDYPGQAVVRGLVGSNGVQRDVPLPDVARVWLLQLWEWEQVADGGAKVADGVLFPISEGALSLMLRHLGVAARIPGLNWGVLAATYRRGLQAAGAAPEDLAYLLGEDRPMVTATGTRVVLPDALELRELIAALDDLAGQQGAGAWAWPFTRSNAAPGSGRPPTLARARPGWSVAFPPGTLRDDRTPMD